MNFASPTQLADADCPACEGSGDLWIFDEYGVECAHVCWCVKRRLDHDRLEMVRRRLPEDLQHVGLDRHPITRMPDQQVIPVRRWADDIRANIDECIGFCLFGPPGTGKSTLAAAAYLLAHQAGYSVSWFRLSWLINYLAISAYGDNAQTDVLEWERKISKIDLLVLDDVAAFIPTESGKRRVYDLLSSREELRKPIIFTSNAQESELDELLGSHTVSRLRGLSGEPIFCVGEDHRKSRSTRKERDLQFAPGAQRG